MADKEVKDAAWFYPEPKEKAMNIKDYVAFCKHLFAKEDHGLTMWQIRTR